ncbi:unnamed protein product, partial [Mesorhabditis belari]|uniref:C-type lectin domain-containing protein n=1 Tax=Mesorhabditis belari TaxID=2138241 RepID=A0AAF3F9X7_9BILA
MQNPAQTVALVPSEKKPQKQSLLNCWTRLFLLILFSYSIGCTIYLGFLIFYFEHLESKCLNSNLVSRPKSEPCLPGWSHSKHFQACYIIIYDVDYDLAKRICQYMDSKMVYVEGETKNRLLISLIRSEQSKTFASGNLILGAQRMNNRFYWDNGSEMKYTHWGSQEPITTNGNENCVLLVTDRNEILSSKFSRWKTTPCNVKQKFSILSSICLEKYSFIEEPKQRVNEKAEVLFSSHIFESCPNYNYKWDDPEILKLLPPTKEEPLCHRENGITLLLRGEVKMNTEYLNYQKYKCKARCAYLDGGYEYKFGSWCTVGSDCKKFNCDFVYINCWLGEELVHIDVHLQIYEHRRNRAEEFRGLYNGHSIPLQSQVTSKGFHPNLYIIVLDSAGRNPAMRQLKKTYKYLVDELGAIDFKKFQRVAYSSRENAFAAFWGIIGEKVDRKAFGGTVIEKTSTCGYPYDNRHYIQFEYEDAGYRTMYAYDYLLDLYMYVDCVGMVNDLATHHSRPFQLLSILPEEVWIDVPFVQYGYQYQNEKLLRKHLRNKTKCGQNYNHMIRYTEEFMNSYKGIPNGTLLEDMVKKNSGELLTMHDIHATTLIDIIRVKF